MLRQGEAAIVAELFTARPFAQAPFRAIHRHGFVRVGAATPAVRPADVGFNLTETARLAGLAAADGADLLAFPELGLTGYAIDDLLHQDALLDRAEEALAALAGMSAAWSTLLVVGAPLRLQGALYNCAVAIQRGRILAAAPKTYRPNYREFYEHRHFAPGDAAPAGEIAIAGVMVPFGTDLLLAAEDQPLFVAHLEVCEDMWAPIPPSTYAAMAGASVMVNLSASNATIGKARERRMLCAARSSACVGAYLYTASGPGESTTDLAWDGQAAVFELGAPLAHGALFAAEPGFILADVDLERIAAERMRMGTFRACAQRHGEAVSGFRTIRCRIDPALAPLPLRRPLARLPFVPDDPAQRDEDCFEAYHIQVQGLSTRIKAAGARTAVIGVSGGLDSAHALIVAAKAFDRLGRPRTDILAYTLPGFATGSASKANAHALMKALGVSAAEIDIRPAAEQMLKDIGHPAGRGEPVYDVTYENVQAGLRTDYLFRLANLHGGLVVGTGDLSELALGWCTYGVGDHMAHYNVNAGAPKTLIQHLIAWCARTGQFDGATAAVLEAILSQEISPELSPPGPDGRLQSTQDTIGPYVLHDFTLHHAVRWGARPSKIAFLAEQAWGETYDLATIKRWMAVFLKRFFETSQFKRSALPNGPKITSAGALSPRGDWRAPSDASAAVWLEELAANTPEA